MKNIYKFLIVAILIILLALTLCACDGGKPMNEENCDSVGHNLVQSSYTAPTCKTTGEEVKKCSRCGFESKTTLLTIAHNYQVKSTTESTCTTRGLQTSECSMCHETKTTTLGLKEHNYKLISSTPSTCVVKGHNDYKCNDCSATKTEELELLAHDYELINTTESTCALQGKKDYKCKNCPSAYSEKLPLASHQYVKTNIAATCFTHGGVHDICSVCNDTNIISETPLLTHSFETDSYCSKCGIYETLFDIDKLDVSWSNTNYLGTIRGKLNSKFKNDNNINNSYWIEHIVTLKITLFDKDGISLGSANFQSSTLESGELVIVHKNYTSANQFSIYFGEFDYFNRNDLQKCTSFKLELSCEGYKSIEKTYDLTTTA